MLFIVSLLLLSLALCINLNTIWHVHSRRRVYRHCLGRSLMLPTTCLDIPRKWLFSRIDHEDEGLWLFSFPRTAFAWTRYYIVLPTEKIYSVHSCMRLKVWLRVHRQSLWWRMLRRALLRRIQISFGRIYLELIERIRRFVRNFLFRKVPSSYLN